LIYLTLRRATFQVSTVAAGECRRTLQTATGHYTVYSNIVVSSCDGEWRSTSCGTYVAKLIDSWQN